MVSGPGTVGTNRRAQGLAAAAAATVSWGFTGIFVDLASLAALPLTFMRLALGAVFMIGLTMACGRRLSWRGLVRSVPGGLFLSADIALFFSAVKLTSIADATVIAALQPALVLMVAHRWFGDRIGTREVAWTALSIAGVVTVVLGGGLPSGHSVTGDALALASLFAFTGYWLVSKRMRTEDLGAGEYTSGVMAVAALAVAPAMVASGQALGPITGRDWLMIVALAVIPGSGHLLINWAHRFVDVSVSSVIGAANPVVAAVAAVAILGQRLTPFQVAGVLVAVAAISVVAGRSGISRRRPGPGQDQAPDFGE